jgi:hypothetical protein
MSYKLRVRMTSLEHMRTMLWPGQLKVARLLEDVVLESCLL